MEFYCENDTAAGGARRCADQCSSCGSAEGQAAVETIAGAAAGLVHDSRCAAWKGFQCNCASAAFVRSG